MNLIQKTSSNKLIIRSEAYFLYTQKTTTPPDTVTRDISLMEEMKTAI